MIFKSPLGNEQKALVISLAIHTFILGSVLYFSSGKPADIKSKPAAIAMNIMTYTPAPKEVLKPVEKPKPTPPPKPKPKPKPKPVKEIPLIKKPIIKEPLREETVADEPLIKEAPEEIVEQQETAKPQEPMKPQKTAQEIQREQEEMRVKQEQEFVQTNFSVIRDMALKNLSYPRIAKKMGWSGIVEIKLVVDTNGRLLEASVIKSSGKEVLDKAALKAALSLKDKVLPKPQIRSTLILPIAFNLR